MYQVLELALSFAAIDRVAAVTLAGAAVCSAGFTTIFNAFLLAALSNYRTTTNRTQLFCHFLHHLSSLLKTVHKILCYWHLMSFSFNANIKTLDIIGSFQGRGQTDDGTGNNRIGERGNRDFVLIDYNFEVIVFVI